jgi:hypothetical protein
VVVVVVVGGLVLEEGADVMDGVGEDVELEEGEEVVVVEEA